MRKCTKILQTESHCVLFFVFILYIPNININNDDLFAKN